MSTKKGGKTKLPKIPPLPDEMDQMDLSQNTLLSTLLNDPASRAMVLQFMSQAQKDIKNKQDQVKKVENKLKKNRFTFESPTAQFRKKELARLGSANSDSESGSSCSTAEKSGPKVPFNQLLCGQVIYVEVFSNGVDKSLSANALVQSMGAKVSDRIARGVTHVIFKDGSYQTYQLAKRLKMHVVSILWLQAVKRNGNLVPEKDYPAFGANHDDFNVSSLCKNLQSEFDEVCQEERTMKSPKINSNVNKTLVNTPKKNQLINASKSASTFSKKALINDSDSDDNDDIVFLSAKSSRTTTSSVLSSTKLPSELSSENGEACKNLNDSLELTANIEEKSRITPNIRNRRRTIYNPEENSMIEINKSKNKRKTMFAIPVLKESNRESNKVNTSKNVRTDNTMELTCLEDSTTTRKSTNYIENSNPIKDTTARRSKTSLESVESINSSTRSSINSNSMDLTSFANNRRRSVRIASKSEEVFKKPAEIIKDNESKESSFSDKLSSLRLSTESNKDQSSEENKKSINNKSTDVELTSSLRLSDSQKINRQSEVNQSKRQSNDSKKRTSTDNALQSENLTSSLHLSETQKTNNNSTTSDLMGEMSQLRIDTSEKDSIEMSSLKLSESIKENPKKRLSDEEPHQDSTPTKKKRPESAKPKQKSSVSESSCSDESGMKKYRKLYDVDDPINNSELIVHIEPIKIPEQTKINISKGRVKKAMELISKPFELTPEIDRGKLKSISSDSDEDSTKNKKPTKKVRRFTKPNKVIVKDVVPSTSNIAPVPQVFATPKTPKKPPLTPSRRSSRFATPITYKKFYIDETTSSLDESIESNATSVITPKLNRRSTMDFSTPIGTSPMKSATQRGDSGSKKGSARPGIACTRFQVGRVNTFAHIVRRLGRFHIDDNVVARTTHLVLGENKRTVNLLRAISRGCWILSADWMYKSMAAGKWLPEEDYEFTDFSEAVQFCRKEREAFGPTYTADTFASCGPIYIARRGTKPTCEELRELVRLAGGELAQVARSATIVVGEVVRRYDIVRWCVSELWVLDSITKNQVGDCKEYSLLTEEDDLEQGTRRERRLSEDY